MKRASIWLWLGLASLAGCTKDPSLSASGGSIIGNGLTDSKEYKNTLVGVDFQYPANWRLQESPDRLAVELDNSGIAPPDKISMIDIHRFNELGGTRFYKVEELQAYLEKTYPDAQWRATQFVGNRHGFRSFALESGTGRSISTYYALDENYNILFISMKGFPEASGEDIAQKIIGSMVIDTDPPELFDVEVEPKAANPGDTVTVSIVAMDDASGIDSDFFEPPQVDLGDFRQSWLGYDLPHVSYEREPDLELKEEPWLHRSEPGVSRGYEPAAAFPFTSAWHRVSAIRYSYSFTIPRGAPGGRVVLANIALKDARGNMSFYTLEPEAVKGTEGSLVSYRDKYEKKVPTKGVPRKPTGISAGAFQVKGGAAAPSPISVIDAFWKSSIVDENNTTYYQVGEWAPSYQNPLYVRMSSSAPIVSSSVEAPAWIGGNCFYPATDVLVAGMAGEVLPASITPDGLLEMDVYFNSPQSYPCGAEGPFSAATRYLKVMQLRDGLGNFVKIYPSDPQAYLKLDFTLDALKKPVVFQGTWN